MKQMICLMSEQLIPSYLAVKHHQPDRVWRILTEVTQKAGRDHMFCETLIEHGGFGQLDLPDCENLVAEPTNFESARHIVTKLLRTAPDDEWVINVAGGNKMIAAGAILAGVIADRPLTYTDIANPNHVVDARTGKAQPFGHGMNVLEFLSLYGFEGTPGTVQVNQPWRRLAGEFAAYPPVVNPFYDNNKKRVTEPLGGVLAGYREKLHKSFPYRLRKALHTVLGGSDDMTAKQYEFVSGGWLEVFLFDLIRKHQTSLHIDDVQPDLKVTRSGVENQFDIALTRGLDFIYIECKAGAQMQHSPSDQIEEILGTVTRLRALRAKALIATTGANFLDKSSGRIKAALENRMREAGMNILTRPDIKELAERHNDTGFIVSRLGSVLTGRA